MGERLYADWFIFIGPGTYWLLAAIFYVFRASVGVAHGLLTLEIGLITGSMYWILTKHAGVGTAHAVWS